MKVRLVYASMAFVALLLAGCSDDSMKALVKEENSDTLATVRIERDLDLSITNLDRDRGRFWVNSDVPKCHGAAQIRYTGTPGKNIHYFIVQGSFIFEDGREPSMNVTRGEEIRDYILRMCALRYPPG